MFFRFWERTSQEKVAEDLKKQTEAQKSDQTSNPAENNDIVVKLRELSDLKNAGIISETDFIEMKKKLIEKY